MHQGKIELFRARAFSDKLNATIEFIRQNIRVLSRTLLFVLVPLAIVSAVLANNFFKTFNASANLIGKGGNSENLLGMIFTPSYYGLLLLSACGSVLVISIVYNFMALYHDKYPEEITVKEIWARAWHDFPHLFVLGFMAFCISMLGFIFIFPGIYLAVVLSLVGSIYVFERKSYVESLSRCFRLIRGKWWSTFGLIVMSGIIAYVILLVFAIPYYVMTFWRANMTLSGTGAEAAPLWHQVAFVISMFVMQLGSYLCQMIPVGAIAFQYFNLVERQESRGLMSDIESLGTSNDNTAS